MLLSWDKSTQIFNTNINLIHSSNGLVFTNPSKNEDCLFINEKYFVNANTFSKYNANTF